MWAAGGLRRQVPADAAASQLGKTSGSALPLLPGDGAQPSPGPFVKCAQYRRGLAEAKVAAPSNEVDGQLLDDPRKARPARASRQFPDPRFEAGNRLRRDAPSRLSSARVAEAQELAPMLASDSHARPSLPSTALRPPGVRDRLSPRVLRPLERRQSGLHPSLRCPSSAPADRSAAWLARDRRSTGLFHRSGLRRRAAAYYALG